MQKKTSIGAGLKNKGYCFVVMPFGGWFDRYYEAIYRPAIEATGLRARRADDIYRPSAIVHDIWELTQNAEIILGDLTDKNPNVLYELGLAHAISKPAVLVTQSLDDVPFDLRSLRILKYDRNVPEWGNELRESIATSIREILADPHSSIPPAFLNVKKSLSTSVTLEQKELIALRQDIDGVKRALDVLPESISGIVSKKTDHSHSGQQNIKLASTIYMVADKIESGAKIPEIMEYLHEMDYSEIQIKDILKQANDLLNCGR